MLSADDGLIHCIVYRQSADWERAFVPQYGRLQSWLTSVRGILTGANYLQTVSLDDLEWQIRWILFILGRQAVPGSSLLQACFQSEQYPYRPFGARASIALICLAFSGIQPENMKYVGSDANWPCDEQFYLLMASRLSKSPLFEDGVRVSQLKVMILSLHQAFRLEEDRAGFTIPQEIYCDNASSTYEYFRQAFRSLDPDLLPKISRLLQTSALTVEGRAYELTGFCAKAFQAAPSVEALEATFACLPEILESQADRIVVIEMFHVRLFQQLKQSFSGQSSRHVNLDQS